MILSEGVLKFLTGFYPPLFFQRIKVLKFEPGFTGATVKIKKSIFNKNYNQSIFGGTIFCAADPFYPLLFHQILLRKGYNVVVWLKSANINYLKPGRSDLVFRITITPDNVAEAELALNTDGKFMKFFQIEMYNTAGELCVSVTNEVYIRNLDTTESSNKA
jgi:acyl-coenzyme A thioesterase PaaI-like protein